MQKKYLILAGVLAVLVVIVLVWAERPQMPPNRPPYALTSLTVTLSDGTVISFKAEVAVTPGEQEYGLMFIPSLPENQAMIFPYAPPRQVAFWMKNTLIPLDMLFVNSGGRIARIVENARPQDLTPIESQLPVSAVIEIGGGVAKKDGIEAGDKISSPVLQ